MRLQQLKRLILLPASAIMLVAVGCHACLLKGHKSGSCQEGCPECAVSPKGTVNPNEKMPMKAHFGARKDARINKDGCSPEKERTPMLTRIADKSNLDSDIPLIKAAAKIKHEEEMCQQKIKAVKYLGTKGCCCYDQDGEVSQAMLDALNDCLPAVRMAAVQAIGGCVCGQAYQKSCCNPKLAAKLHEMAFETTDNGCPKEPNQQIREWAAYVAQSCPKKLDNNVREDIPGPTPLEGGKKTDSYDESGSDKVPAAPPEALPPQTSNDDGSPATPNADKKVSSANDAADSQIAISKHQPAIYFLRSQNLDVCQQVSNVAAPDADLHVSSRTSAFSSRITPAALVERQVDRTAAVPETTESDTFVASNVFNNDVDARQEFAMKKIGLVSANDEDSQDPFETKPVTVTLGTAVTSGVAALSTQEPFETNQATASRPQADEALASQKNVIAQPAPPSATPAIPAVNPAPIVQNAGQISRPSSIQGRIESVDLQNETAVIRLPDNMSAGTSCRVHVVHKYALGRIQAIGEFEVLASNPGVVTIRPVAGTSMRKISVGDAATVFGN